MVIVIIVAIVLGWGYLAGGVFALLAVGGGGVYRNAL